MLLLDSSGATEREGRKSPRLRVVSSSTGKTSSIVLGLRASALIASLVELMTESSGHATIPKKPRGEARKYPPTLISK